MAGGVSFKAQGSEMWPRVQFMVQNMSYSGIVVFAKRSNVSTLSKVATKAAGGLEG